jgi:beta-lactamase class A
MRARHGYPAIAAALLAAAAACAAPPGAETPAPTTTQLHPPPTQLQPILDARAREVPGEVSVAVIDLATGARVGIRDDVVKHAASTMKVPVLVELHRQAAEGRFALEDPLEVRTTFASLVDGSPYRLTVDDDSEHALYRLEGRDVARGELARRMIVRSSNLATNLLIDDIGADAVARTMTALGAGGMVVRRGVQDIPAFEAGLNNTATARALATLLAAVARCERGDVHAALRPLAAADCARIVDVLAGQEFTDRIPAGVPTGVRVAHKTGWISTVDHDAAIVHPPGREPYVLVVLTRNVADRADSRAAIRDLSALTWRELVGRHGPVAHPAGPDGARPAELARLHDRHRVAGLEDRTFNHAHYWSVVDPVLARGTGRAPGLRVEEIGRSVEGREIRAITYGHGPTTALLWSQMHGDESTATMALADIIAFLADDAGHPLARRLADRLTVVMVPMLNPDGAERFQRRNAMGIDINRDARALVTPEGRALKAIRDRVSADWGFNLHDQNVRLRVGDTERQAAMAFLAPPWGDSRDDDVVRERAARLAGVLRLAVDSLVHGRVARYDDAFNPRAFGDLMQQWGTSTILIESGGWDGDPEKQHLRRANFVGILTALDASATGGWADVSPDWYRTLPFNGSPAQDLVLRGGQLVWAAPSAAGGTTPPYRADLAVQFADASRWVGPRLADVGDLGETIARRSLDIDGLYAHIESDTPGELGPVRRIVVRRGPQAEAPVVWIIGDGGATRPGAHSFQARQVLR